MIYCGRDAEIMKDIRRCLLSTATLEFGAKPQDTSTEFYQRLLESVKKEGIKQPLLMLNIPNRWVIKVGNSRLWAAKTLGIEEVDCIVVTLERDLGKVIIPQGRKVTNIRSEFTCAIIWNERENYVGMKCAHTHLDQSAVR